MFPKRNTLRQHLLLGAAGVLLYLSPCAAQQENGTESAAPPPAVSEETKAAAAQLERVHVDIRREEERLKTLRLRQREIETELKKIQSDLNAAGSERAKTRKDIERLDAQAGQLVINMAEMKEKIAQLSAALDKRITAIYKTRRRTAGLDYLFQATSATDFLKRAYYLAIISKSDREQINALDREFRRLKETEIALRR